jgi:hypothetical protein
MGKIADKVMAMMQAGARNADILATIKRMEDGVGLPAEQLQQEFAIFWGSFPNKTGKADAMKAYAVARRKASAQQILDGVERYRNKRDDRPWCNPGTFLRQCRWEDEVAQRVVRNDTLGASFLSAAIAAKGQENAAQRYTDPIGGPVRRLPRRQAD